MLTSLLSVEAIAKYLQDNPIRPWFSPWRGVRAGLVKGIPWLEDLHRYPKNRIKIEFVPKAPGEEAVELSQETIYSIFRRYGKISEITSQASDSKVAPRYAYIDFMFMRDSIMARNCLHGIVVSEALGGGKAGTKLRLSYEQIVKAHRIWDWITNHPRIVIPLVAALIAAVSVVIFDPIRTFFIKAHVQHSFKFRDSTLYKWFQRQTSDLLSFRRQRAEQAGLTAIWSHRRDLIDQIQTWLLESTDTFIVVQGPRGSGKRELVTDQALKDRANVLLIDCKPIVEARGESGTLRALANAVGYRPVFSWVSSISGLVDLAVQSTTGVKSGFSETLDSQIAKILHTTAGALSEVAIAERKKMKISDKDESMTDDAFLDAHPERRAVVVIDNFAHRNEDSAGLVYDRMAEWAAALVQNNIAHVIFLADDSSFSKSLSRALPDRVFRQVALGDLSPDVAKKFVMSHLEEELNPDGTTRDSPSQGGGEAKQGGQQRQPPGQGGRTPEEEARRRQDSAELDQCISSLGGRLTDLEFLARRLRAGQSPNKAVEEIIEQSASEILKMFLLAPSSPSAPVRSSPSSSASSSGSSSSSSSSGPGRSWSGEQAWYLVKALAGADALRYGEVLLSPTFASSTTPSAASGEAALDALASAELITVGTSNGGRPASVSPGRPVFQAAFKLLARDKVLRAQMDLRLLAEVAKVEAKNIDKAEAELALLGSLPRQPPQTAGRVDFLLAKLEASQAKIVAIEAEMAGLKKVLGSEF